MKLVKGLALVLVIIGALNWGLWGFFQFDFVAWIGGGNTTGLARFIYAIIGLAGLLMLFRLGRMCCCSCCCGNTCPKCGKTCSKNHTCK